MIDDIIGEWDLTLGENGRGEHDGRIAFLAPEGRLLVRDADPEVRLAPSRVESADGTLRFELLAAGSSRGNAHYSYELRRAEDGTLRGTKRRGLLARTPLVATRVAAAVTVGTTEATPLSPVAADPLAEVRARAAAAAERANLAAAQAAAAAAEADAAEAFEAARQAAARVAAARAAVQQFGPGTAQPGAAPQASPRTEVPSEVLAVLPAPSQAPVFAPAPAPAPAAAEAASASVLDDAAAADASEPLPEGELHDSMAG